MPNKNYLAGRRFEYELKKSYEKAGAHVMRTAGSHGKFDLIVIPLGLGVDKMPQLIQCKVVTDKSRIKKLEADFRAKTVPHTHFLQVLAVKTKYSGDQYLVAI